MNTHRFVVWLLCLLVAMPVAAESIQAPRFAYGANNGDWSLTAYRVDPATGTLSHHGNWYAGASTAAVAVHPAGFVISVSMTEDWLNVHRILADGRLTKIPQSPIKAGVRAPFSISLHPAGRFVYVSARGGQVAGFVFDSASGVLTPVPGSPFDAQRRTRSVVVHPSGQYVYASNAYDNSVSAWRVDGNTGELSPLSGSPFATGEPGNLDPDLLNIIDAPPEAGGIPYMVAVHPSGRYLYVTNWMGPSLSMFKVDEDSGELSPLPGSPMLMGNSPYAVTAHPSGRFVYVTSWDAQAVYGYSVDVRSGVVHELSDSPYYTQAKNPIALRLNAEGSLAYAVSSGSNTVSVFDVDSVSGSLVLKQTMRSRYEPFDIALAEGKPAVLESRFAYSINDQTLRQFRVNGKSGELISVAELKTGFTAHAVTVDPRGRFVYLAGESGGQGRLGIYRINSEGGLTPLKDTPHEMGIVPKSLVLDTSGNFIYMIDPDNPGLFVFAVNSQEGFLSTLRDPLPRTGQQPVAIAMDPAARFSFVANAGDNTVSVFTHRREGSAAMYPIEQPGSKYAVGKNPRALAVGPTGKFLFVANRGDNTLSVFKIHYHDGSLEALPGTPVSTGKSPSAVVVHPGGQWVLVANRDSGTLSVYQLDSLKGVLKMQSSFKVGSRPVAITLDPTGRTVYIRNEGQKGLRRFVLDVTSGKLKSAGKVDVGPVVDLVLDAATQ